MNIMIFVAGAVVGALAAFTFIFICMAIINKKPENKQGPKITLDEDLVKELWKDYLKETQDDGK